jgi:hypothetical protein
MKKDNSYYDLQVKDEYYTPAILVEIVLPYLKPNSTIWCPFDTQQSEFVKVLEANGHTVLSTHIWKGLDFFEFQPHRFDYVISNPPFSLKNQVIERLVGFGKPFALLLNLQCLNYIGIRKLVRDNKIQLLIPDKNVSYDGGSCPFASLFYCYKMNLPSSMEFADVPHKNTGKNFEPSAMYNLDLQY